MKLSTRGRYGARLMLDLAFHYGEGNILLKDISARQEISEKYLGHLIPPLKNAGLVHSARGAHGGYSLAKHPSQITMKDIVTVLEGDICIVDCVSDPAECGRINTCVTRDIWEELRAGILEALSSYTLEDMVEKQKDKFQTFSYTI